MGRNATQEQSSDRTYSSLFLIGGTDSVPGFSRRADLDVLGGARIKKTLISDGDFIVSKDATLNGNITVLGNSSFDTLTVTEVCGNILTDLIQAKNSGNISVSGNIVLDDMIDSVTTITLNKATNVNGNISVNGTQVVGPQQPAVTAITLDATLGNIAPDGSLVVTGNTAASDTSATINNNFADLTEKVNKIFELLATHGLMA